MSIILYAGMDVHTTNYTISCYSMEEDATFGQVQLEPDYLEVIKYLQRVKKMRGDDCEIICGYEAGCLGYSLYHQLNDAGYKCVILAPTTIPSTATRVKTDKRDAQKIARCLAYHTYSPVYVPSDDDNAVKEYIRMRDDEKIHVKGLKQRIIAFYTRHGKSFSGKSTWTVAHMTWLKSLRFGNTVLDEAFNEYLVLLTQSLATVERYDRRITELANKDQYKEKVKMLCCLIGISIISALSLIVETGDFNRFAAAEQYASFLGLVPGEHSSGDARHRSCITKAGNQHLRRLLTEAAQCYTRGRPGLKTKGLCKKQEGNTAEVIAYADRANIRLKRKFHKLAVENGRNRNIAVTAVARELGCFVWGMMTNHIA